MMPALVGLVCGFIGLAVGLFFGLAAGVWLGVNLAMAHMVDEYPEMLREMACEDIVEHARKNGVPIAR
jgi:ABC-type nitrate/sulfonate/bicarbonate transport system permease component